MEILQSAEEHIRYDAMTGANFEAARFTQPEELAFMFMKVMDDISKASLKARKIKK